MLVPKDTLKVEKADEGFVATTSLIDGATGAGHSEQEAVANLDWAVRAHLKMERGLGREIPAEFRVSTTRKVLTVGLFLVLLAVLRVAVHYLFFTS